MVAFDKPKTGINALSYSSVSAYSECGEKWRLSRVYGLDNQTWWATLMGTAVHYVTEQYDRATAGLQTASNEVAPDDFHAVFAREVDKAERLNLDVLASGRELKNVGLTGGPNKKDREWCEHYGPLFVQSWIDWRQQHNFKVAFLPDGTPGIECELATPVGGFPFRGFVDRVFETPDGEFVAVDLKTGSTPASSLQLQAYAAMLRECGVNVSRGGFWLASKGSVVDWVDTPGSGDFAVHALVSSAGRGIESGVFVPRLSALCKGCGVRDYCAAFGGGQHDLVAGSVPVRIGQVVVDEATGEVVL